MNERDRRYIEQAVSRAKRKNPALSATVFDFLQDVLLLKYPEDFGEKDKMEWLDFVMRFQQVTGPVMAKGLEDTVFYVYNRLRLPQRSGWKSGKIRTRPSKLSTGRISKGPNPGPARLIATSTHDTKRSEDVRARLNVLSEIPDEWRHHLATWSRINKRKKSVVDGQCGS